MFETSAERALREELERYFENLPEEEKETFRKYIREQLKTKEDLERLIQQLGLKWMENEENREKAEKYLRLKQEIKERGIEELEKIAKELELDNELAKKWAESKSRPKLINSILHNLGERTWFAIVEMRMQLNTPRSMKEIHEIIEQNPELRKLPHFKQMLEDVKAWIEIMDMKKDGMLDIITDKQGNEKFLLSEIRDLSLKYGVSESEVLDWLRGRTYPPFVRLLREYNARNRFATNEPTTQSNIPATFDAFNELLEKHSHVREQKSFDKFYNQVMTYYAISDELETGDLNHLSARQRWKYLAKKYGVSEYTVKGWFAKKQLPRLLRDVVNYEANPEQPYPKSPTVYGFDVPSTLAEFELLLKRNPYIMERKGFDKMYHDVKAYFQMKEILARDPDIGDSELSRRLGVSRTTLRKWRKGETQPNLLTQLMKNERLRRELEQSIPNEAYQYWIDPSEVYHTLRKLERGKQVDIDKIAGMLKDLYLSLGPQRTIGFAHLKPYNSQHGPRWLLNVAKAILRHREDIVKKLNEKMGFDANPYHELRIAVVDNVLYFWGYQTSQFDPLNLFGDELFYFSKRERKRLTRKARTALGLKGDYHFSELVRQICNYRQTVKKLEERIISDFRPESRHLKGNVVKFILSVTQRTLKDMESTIKRFSRSTSIMKMKQQAKMDEDLKIQEEIMMHSETIIQGIDSFVAEDINSIVNALENLYSTLNPDDCVWFVHLKSYYKQDDPIWWTDIVGRLGDYHMYIEHELNKRLNLVRESNDELKISLLDNTLYIWKRNISQFDLTSLFQNELFYFSKEDRNRLLAEAQHRLALKSTNEFYKLIRSLCGNSQIPRLTPDFEYLHGSVIKFILDITRKTMKDVGSMIKRLGRGKQVVNLRILSETEMQILLARLFAIISSDGSIEQYGRTSYYEKDPIRRQRVRDLLAPLGILHLQVIKNKDGTVGGFHLPNVIGRLLVRFGIPIGDKVLQGVQLPDFIKYGSLEVQLAYLEELIPEEGWVTIDKERYARIGISRTVILHDPEKGVKFGFVSKLTDEQVQFIYKLGKRVVRTYGKKDIADIFRKLTMGRLRELQQSDDPDVARVAREIEDIVLTNNSQHLDDEVFLCESNGIMMQEPYPSGVDLSESTGRVSVKWQVGTSSQDDVAMWGVLALPNDVRKRSILKKWMKKNKDRVNEAKEKLIRAKENIRGILEASKQEEGVEEV